MLTTFPQLVAFDLDDTLLLPSGELSNRTLNAVRQLHKRGVLVVLASGRMLANMLPVAERLGFNPSIVSFNGAQVNLSSSQAALYHCPVPPALAERVIDWAFERDLHLHFYHDNRLFANRIDDWQARIYHEQTGAHLELESDFDRLRGLPATKLLIADEPERVEVLLGEAREVFGAELMLTRSKPIYLEFLHPTVNKGEGFKALCRHLDIPLSATAAFGDGYNDREMLQACGYAVVVYNGIEEIKALATLVCASNEEDGVAQVLEDWLSSES
jgi:Cof subfamily protein (haloacid dehalogenase superfamily)